MPKLLAYINPAPLPLIRRCDTSAQLLAISLYLAKKGPEHPLAPDNKIHPSAQLEQQSRVSQEDSLVAENVKLGFRSNIKESVIGANCDIGKNVRMTRCLLMEGVTVGDGVQLIGCTVGRRAKIEGTKVKESDAAAEAEKGGRKKKGADDDDDKTRLTDCEIAPGFVVESGTEAKGEKMMVDIEEGEEDFAGDDEDQAGS